MIIAKLADLYTDLLARGEDLPPFGYAVQGITGALCVDDRGRVVDVLDLRVERGARKVPSKLIVPAPPKRTSAIAPGFLCDTSEYLLGLENGMMTRRSQNRRLSSMHLHERLLRGVEHPAARAILSFFENYDAQRLARPEQAHRDVLAGRLVFRHLGGPHQFAHEVPDLGEVWARHVESTMLDQPRGQCLATGTGSVPIARIHPAIKGVRGALATGSALVSANQSAFTSYGKKQCLNAPVSTATAFAYASALNYLLSDTGGRRVYLGDVSVVAWTDRPSAAEAVVRWFFLGHSVDRRGPIAGPQWENLLEPSEGGMRSLPTLEHDRGREYCVLALTSNAARAAVRLWICDSFGTFSVRLDEHCRDLAIETTRDQPWLQVPLPRLVQEFARKTPDGWPDSQRRQEDALLGRIYIELAGAVAQGLPYPRMILQALIRRLGDDRCVTRMRMALLKAIIARRRRYEGRSEEVPMTLDNDQVGPYRVGRLVALLEQVQRAVRLAVRVPSPQPNEPRLAERFIAGLARRPASHLPRLLQHHLAHMRKLRYRRPGLAIWFERQIDEVLRLIAPDDLRRTYSLEDQGMVYLGYYHQRSARSKASEAGSAADGKVLEG